MIAGTFVPAAFLSIENASWYNLLAPIFDFTFTKVRARYLSSHMIHDKTETSDLGRILG